MATASRHVFHLADIGQVANLVAAAAQIIEGVGAEWIRAQLGHRSHQPVPTVDLVSLLAALEALEAKS